MDFILANSSSQANESVAHLNSLSSGPDPEDQCPAPAEGILFLVFMEILTTVVGFPGNVCVIYLMLRGEVERSTADVFTLGLAVLDTAYCLTLPLHLVELFLLNNVVVFQLRLFLLGLNEIGSPLFLSCICTDRYFAVVHPIVFLKFSNRHHRYREAALVWLATLLLQSGPASGELHPIKRRAFRTVLTIFMIIIISFLPAAVTYPFEPVLPDDIFECYIFPICYGFITLRAALQALFFLGRTRKLTCRTSDLDNTTDNCVCC
ncbi:hypothetical protein AOLI_G00235050 [Acnodon oligacanthus]